MGVGGVLFDEARDCLRGLFDFLVRRLIGLSGRVDDAVGEVVVEQADGDCIEGGLDGGHLREDVNAVFVLGDHALQAADLAFDAAC